MCSRDDELIDTESVRNRHRVQRIDDLHSEPTTDSSSVSNMHRSTPGALHSPETTKERTSEDAPQDLAS